MMIVGNTVHLSMKELQKINSILAKFDNVNHVDIKTECVIGLSKITTIKFEHTVNGIDCFLETEIDRDD